MIMLDNANTEKPFQRLVFCKQTANFSDFDM